MEVIYERCAGLDVHKKSVVACVRVQNAKEEVRTFQTFRGDLQQMAAWLESRAVPVVAMEATGVYWKPVWQVLEGRVELLLVNARHVKAVPGRKTDVKDAQWLAQLLAAGLLRGNFVPPRPIRDLRELTRYRKRQIQAMASEVQRVDKTLEDTGIKLGSVASHTLGVSGRLMLEALCAGERDPEVLADMAKGVLRRKKDELRAALVGDVTHHHELLLTLQLQRIDDLGKAITALDERIDEVMEPFASHRDRLCTIPGVAKRSAECIIAEIGVDMSVFPTSKDLASWAGLCPGTYQSANSHRPGQRRKGSRWLCAALVQCAHAAARTNNTYLRSQYWNIARRRGKGRAAIAVSHTILESIWFMFSTDTDWIDLGEDYLHRRRDPNTLIRHATRQLETLGYRVDLTPVA